VNEQTYEWEENNIPPQRIIKTISFHNLIYYDNKNFLFLGKQQKKKEKTLPQPTI